MIFLSGTDIVSDFSTRASGNMSLGCGDTKSSLKNREGFLSKSGIDYRDLICARQAHGSNVRYATEEDKGRGALSPEAAFSDTDGFITDRRNVALAVFTADCLPIFLHDPKNFAIGLAHAGWRGTKENIAGKTVNLMKAKFNTEPQDLHVGLGPAVRHCCYEVGEEFKIFFPDGFIERDKHYYLDLIKINKKQLLCSGVQDINIFDCGICTSCRSQDFFSYRKEGVDCGRMMSVIMLK